MSAQGGYSNKYGNTRNWKVQYKKNSLLCYWKFLKLSSNTVQVFKVHSWGRAVITPNNSAVSLEWLTRLTIYSAPGAGIYKTKTRNKQYINDDFQQYLYQSSRKHPTGYLYPSVKEQLIINIRPLCCSWSQQHKTNESSEGNWEIQTLVSTQ